LKLRGWRAIGVLASALALAACSVVQQAKPPPPDPVVLAAGDIAMCTNPGSKGTAALLEKTEGTILAVGDEAYNHGSADDFANCYAPTWGRFKDRTHPVPGNHEFEQPKGAPYFNYFGPAAGEPGKGWYSFDLGSWHIVALNSNCSYVGCGADSEQTKWLRDDLAAHPAACTMAFWHHPRFSSGPHGSDPMTLPFWDVLYKVGADVVLSGHDHEYERFALQSPSGEPDPAWGIRQFVVGTGGADSYKFQRVQPNSEARQDGIFGVLKLVLHADGYDWEYLQTGGPAFADAGGGKCHGRRT
jgi:acid phosphatase type 7